MGGVQPESSKNLNELLVCEGRRARHAAYTMERCNLWMLAQARNHVEQAGAGREQAMI